MKHTHHSILILTLSTLTLGLLFVPFGLRYKIHQVGTEIVAMTKESTKLEEARSISNEARRAALEMEENLQSLSSHMLTNENVAFFLAELETLSTVTGAEVAISDVSVSEKITVIDPKATAAQKKAEVKPALQVSLTATGTFTELYKLVHIIEVLPYEIAITNEQMTVLRETLVEGETLYDPNPDWTLILSLMVTSYE